VTPKSYLEFIQFYKNSLIEKRGAVKAQMDRLQVGLTTLRKTAVDVAELQEVLKGKLVKVAEQVQATEELLAQMGEQRAEAEKQSENATVEKEKADAASAVAAEIEAQCKTELDAATPAMEQAKDSVNCLDKSMLTELKNLPKPPAGVDLVTKGCLIMVENEYRNFKWDRARKMLSKVDKFLEKLVDYDGAKMPENVVEMIGKLCENPQFTVATMKTKSEAAANLCSWVVNIYTYNRIYVKVAPLMQKLEEAQAERRKAEEQLAVVEANVRQIEEKVALLKESYVAATEAKHRVEAEAQTCKDRLSLAERLVNGLASENERWGREIEKLKENEVLVVGDVLLASAFVSYIGAFDSQFRKELVFDHWIPDLENMGIPLAEDPNPLNMLTNEGINAKMMQEGLPADSVSFENGAIVLNAKRWPLLIDPQLQGIKWLREKEAGKLDGGSNVIQLTSDRWERKLQNCIENGMCCIIEGVGEEIDATLDPVLARSIVVKGKSIIMKFGDEEVNYDPEFQLYLQTKMSNPHYKPELLAQCTLVNFIATESGLEEQLLAKAVGVERPDLESEKQE
jgi:dynein heavy chain